MLKVLLKKQMSEIFHAYFYDAKKNRARSRVSIVCYFILFALLIIGLLGGLFGLVRGLIVAILLLCLVPSIITLVSPEVVEQLLGGSSLYKFIMQLDFIGVSKTITRLIG